MTFSVGGSRLLTAPCRCVLRSPAWGQQQTSAQWEVIVVVNNSTDDTTDVLDEAASELTGRLRVITESEQGHCAALNAGIRAAQGDVCLDHESRRSGGKGLDREGWSGAHAVSLRLRSGGRAMPIWQSAETAWLPDGSGPHCAVLALLVLWTGFPAVRRTRPHWLQYGISA